MLDDETILHDLSKLLFQKAGITEVQLDSYIDFCDLISKVRKNTEKIEQFSEDEINCIEEFISQYDITYTVQNIWKYAFFSGLLENVGCESLTGYFDILPTLISEEPADIDDYLVEHVHALNLRGDSSGKAGQEAVDICLGCFFIAIELSAETEDGEDSIIRWVTSFGNYFEYDGKITDILAELDSQVRDVLIETFIEFVQGQYHVDIEDHRYDDGTPNWESLASDVYAAIA